MRFFGRRLTIFTFALGLGLSWGSAAVAQDPPDQPLEEVVQAFAEKELAYATAHPRYNFRLVVRIQELDKADNVIGTFEQEGMVTFDRRGRRKLTLMSNPHSDLTRLGIQRIELEDISRIPLFILRPDEIPQYDISYLTSEKVDEVRTHLFQLGPKGVPHAPEVYFDGIVYVDARKLDIVRASGRMVPEDASGALGRFFQHIEIYREPVDDHLFTTYIRSDDVISARRGEEVNARLVIRFLDHTLVGEGEGEGEEGDTQVDEAEPAAEPPADPPTDDSTQPTGQPPS